MLQRDASFTRTKVNTGTSTAREASPPARSPRRRSDAGPAAASLPAAVDAPVEAPEEPSISDSCGGAAILIGALLAEGALLATLVDDLLQGGVAGFEAGKRIGPFPFASRDSFRVLATQKIGRAEAHTHQPQALQEAASGEALLVQVLLDGLGAFMLRVAIIAHWFAPNMTDSRIVPSRRSTAPLLDDQQPKRGHDTPISFHLESCRQMHVCSPGRRAERMRLAYPQVRSARIASCPIAARRREKRGHAALRFGVA